MQSWVNNGGRERESRTWANDIKAVRRTLQKIPIPLRCPLLEAKLEYQSWRKREAMKRRVIRDVIMV